jgi:hypothetical protein
MPNVSPQLTRAIILMHSRYDIRLSEGPSTVTESLIATIM